MSKLEKLIQQYCPDGVEWKTLGELGNFYSGLSGKTKSDFTGGNEKFITYVNVFNNPSLKTDVPEKVKIAEGERQNTIQYGDILFTGSSETPDECGMSSVLTHRTEEKLYLNSFCFGFRFFDLSDKCPSFMKYLFRSTNIRKAICKTANGVTRYNISKKEFAKIEIPIIPLPVQEEIVRVLDAFTELQAELQKRKQQYNFYRDNLLNFKDINRGGQEIKWMKLGEICEFRNGFAFKSNLFKNEGFPIIRITNISEQGVIMEDVKYFHMEDYPKTKMTLFEVNNGDILVAMSGATTGKIGTYKEDATAYLNQRTGKFVPKPQLNNRFLYHFLLTKVNEMYRMSGGGAQPNLSSTDLKSKILIPLPSLAEQQKIVAILDRFDALTNDLTSGLPAEMEKRRQQYEFYRDNLLTFKRKEA